MKFSSVALLVWMMAWPPVTAAQTAESFEQLQKLVRQGETVSVQDVAGRISQGRIVALSDTLLILRGATFTRDFPEDQVLAITQRRQDSLGNGALIGLAVGAGFAMATVVSSCGDDGWINLCEGSTALALAGIWGGLGAGIGAGVDAVIVHSRAVYRAPRRDGSFRILPIFSPNRAGVLVSMSR